jgi:TPR repeat protein
MDSRGTGVFKNNDKSFVFGKASAEQNNDIGQFRLGFADERGSGEDKDMLTCLAWCRNSAAQGNRSPHDALKRIIGESPTKTAKSTERWVQAIDDN